MEIEKFDLIQHSPGMAEACRFLMPIGGGAPDDEDDDKGGEGDDDKSGDLSDDEIEKILSGDGDGSGAKDKEKDGDKDDEGKDDELTDEEKAIEIQIGKKIKAKAEDILKWRKASLQEGDYTKKSQQLASEFKRLEALKEMQEYLQKNPAKLKKVLAILDEAEEAAADAAAAGGDKDDVMGALDDVLKKLDLTKPENQLLKILAEMNKGFAKKIKDGEAAEAKSLKDRQQLQVAEQVKKATELLNTTLTSAFKTLKTEDEDEQKLIRQMTLSFLKDNPKEYADDDDFKATIVDVAKKMKASIDKIGEKALAGYLKRKGGPAAPAGGGNGNGTPKKTDLKQVTSGNLQELIEKELEEIEAGQS